MARRGTTLLVVGVGCGLAAVGACDITGPDSPAVFLTPPSLTLEDGQTAKISAKLRNPRSRTVIWSSSNPGVATVDPTGKVTGIINGSATITAKMTDDTTVTASVPVTVSGPAVAMIAVSPAAVTVHVGLAFRMGVQLRAADGRIIRGRRIAWTSPDTRIAEVTAQGIVRGRAPGGPIELVASVEGRTASTRVRVAHAAELCPFITPLALGERAEGHLALGDCEFALDDSFVDVYELTLAEPGSLQIDMMSSEVDAFIGLFSGAGFFLAEDDNSGGERNARLVTPPLEAGVYRVWANTATGASAGAYSLTVVRR
ncbi:MAG TPA: Ig-like domain-containing protein [Gemmatimonadaceae bacterium]|nr:Ig-like domain-containing protein [Gemmatimonadaceae bacterium]